MVHLSNTEVFVVRNQLQADLESELVVGLNLNPMMQSVRQMR